MAEKRNHCSILNYKKASIIDVLPLMLLVFIFSICAVVGYVIYDGMVDAGFYTILTAAVPMQAGFERTFDAMDWMVGFLFVGAAISSIVGAILIRSHPAFFFLSIVVLLIEIVVSTVFSNIWYELVTNASMSSALTQFPVADWVLSNLPVMILVIALVMAVVMYAVNPFDQ